MYFGWREKGRGRKTHHPYTSTLLLIENKHSWVCGEKDKRGKTGADKQLRFVQHHNERTKDGNNSPIESSLKKTFPGSRHPDTHSQGTDFCALFNIRRYCLFVFVFVFYHLSRGKRGKVSKT